MMPKKPHIESIERYIINDVDRSPYLRLDKNEFSFDFPKELIDDFKNIISNYVIQAYPSTFNTLEQASHLLAHKNKNEILLIPGSDYALKVCFEAFTDAHDKVGLPTPTYAMNDVYAKIANTPLVSFSYNSQLTLPYDDILSALPSLKMLVLTNPNQPTGQLEDEKSILSILDKAKQHGVWVVMDEAYFSYSKFTFAGLVSDFSNLVIIRSFSKSYGLAGLRMGAMIAREDIIRYLAKALPVYCVNSFALATLPILVKYKEYFDKCIEEQISVRQEIIKFYSNLGMKPHNSYTNFVMIETNNCINAKDYINKMANENILLRGPWTKSPYHDAFRVTTTNYDNFVQLKNATLKYLS